MPASVCRLHGVQISFHSILQKANGTHVVARPYVYVHLLSDFLTFWLYDFLTLWIYDFLTLWLCDFLSFWISDILTLWLYDFMTFWISEFLIFWLSEFLTLWTSDFLTFWCSDFLTIWQLQQLHCTVLTCVLNTWGEREWVLTRGRGSQYSDMIFVKSLTRPTF